MGKARKRVTPKTKEGIKKVPLLSFRINFGIYKITNQLFKETGSSDSEQAKQTSSV
jgi:hypothetical protein